MRDRDYKSLRHHLELDRFSAVTPTPNERFQIIMNRTNLPHGDSTGRTKFTLPEVYREVDSLFGTDRATTVLARCTIKRVAL